MPPAQRRESFLAPVASVTENSEVLGVHRRCNQTLAYHPIAIANLDQSVLVWFWYRKLLHHDARSLFDPPLPPIQRPSERRFRFVTGRQGRLAWRHPLAWLNEGPV